MKVNRAEVAARASRSDLHDRLYVEIDGLIGTAWRSWVRDRLDARTERWLRRQLLAAREAIDRVLLEEGC